MAKLSLDLTHTQSFLNEGELDHYVQLARQAAASLDDRTGPGNDYLGWLDLPTEYDREEFARIKKAARRIQQQSEILVVVGIGGSYLGARAALQFLGSAFDPMIDKGRPTIIFAGTQLSSDYHTDLLNLLKDRDFSVNMISKSGTTTEPAIAFRFLRALLEEKYGAEGARERIYATTDRKKGALKTLADREGYETFVVPDDVGGRFSVLTAVGLLPLAVANVDLDQLMKGAAAARERYAEDHRDNDCYRYAAVRNALLQRGKIIEMLVAYEPRLQNIGEWWKQLFGESEGKDGKGIFPTSAMFTTDLHSLGQYIQDGRRHLFETLIHLESVRSELNIESDESNLDGLNYLTGKSLEYVNEKAIQGTIEAHVEGGVPNIILRVPAPTAYHLGELFFFFERACAVSGYMLGVNPFDQPGVEAYKRNMFRLLGKPGR